MGEAPCQEVQVVMQNGARFVRQFQNNDPSVLAAAVRALRLHAAERTLLLEGQEVAVAEIVSYESVKAITKPRTEPTITNICGSVTHTPAMRAVYPGMRAVYQRVPNICGEFYGLHHLDCNLVTSGKQHSTLFRGGRCSQKITAVIDTAIDQTQVRTRHLHMIVCASHLGHPVRVGLPMGAFLDKVMTSDPRWSARVDYNVEDLAAVKSIRVEKLSDELLQQLLPPPLRRVRLLLLHVGALGFVNIFLTLHKGVDFYVGIEHDLMPLFRFFDTVVAGAC